MELTHPVQGSSLYVTLSASHLNPSLDPEKALSIARELAGEKEVQLFDAGSILCPQHIFRAATNAYNAMAKGYNVSRALPVETLLYVAGERQIRKAFEIAGVTPETGSVVVSIFGERASPLAGRVAGALGDVDVGVLEPSLGKAKEVAKHYQLPLQAIEALGRDYMDAVLGLLTERGALLPLQP